MTDVKPTSVPNGTNVTPKEAVEQLLIKGNLLNNIRSSSMYSEAVRIEAIRRMNKNIRDLRTYGNHVAKLEKLLEDMKK